MTNWAGAVQTLGEGLFKVGGVVVNMIIQKDQVKIAWVQVPEKSLPRTIGLDAMAIFLQGRLEPFLDDSFIINDGDVHGTPDSGAPPARLPS